MNGNHLDRARRAAVTAHEHCAVPELARPAMQRAIMHALIDIAESLRARRLTVGAYSIDLAALADQPLESVGTDDDDDGYPAAAVIVEMPCPLRTRPDRCAHACSVKGCQRPIVGG